VRAPPDVAAPQKQVHRKQAGAKPAFFIAGADVEAL
jgi:hypothetical protein